MEGAGHKGRWNKKARVGIVLLLMWMLSPTLALLQSSEEKQCPEGDILTEDGVCCNKCHAGTKLVEKCHATGQRSNCTSCPDGQFMDDINYSPNCRRCRRCKESKHEIQISPCTPRQNTICQCENNYYRYNIDSGTYECRRCARCGLNERETRKCTPQENTVCECEDKYHKVNGKCEPCKNCNTECKHLCPAPTTPNHSKASDAGKEFLVNVVAVVGAVAIVLLVLVILITYFATKWFTEKKLQEVSSQPSDVSQDSCQQVLISSEGPWDNSSEKPSPISPVSEQDPSNLPDCVPLEIQIPDLIYTVLDLVPVLQVKQLVRTLGVTDKEIEQAEMDHRSCREAHYQMLRVWAERGSRAGGGGRGRVVHSLLLQELLDKVRMMHLGQAVEELETKYGIQ